MENKKVTDFKKDLKFGEAAEKEFANRFPIKLSKIDGKKHDFEDSLGTKIELKTDRWLWKSSNLAFEIYSNSRFKTPGGSFKAEINGCKYFIIYSPDVHCYFLFDTKILNDYLEQHIEKNKSNLKAFVWTNTANYSTVSVIIPITYIQHIMMKINFDKCPAIMQSCEDGIINYLEFQDMPDEI